MFKYFKKPRSKYDLLPQTSHESTSDSDDGSLREKSRLSRFSPRKLRRICRSRKALYMFLTPIILLVLQLLFNNSYAHPPPFEVNTKERVFIAANIVDGHLIQGPWGKSVRELVELLGRERVFVSVYGGPKEALHEFARSLPCEHAIVVEDEHPIDLETLPKAVLPTNGQQKTKRIAYLAEVRNHALAPLLESKKYYEKVLFLNDVFFTPADALRLMWGTNNVGPNGEAMYKAACAADFISSWKYYDTFATRDAEGNGLGVPIYPWFSGQGAAVSRKDVFAQKNNVRVKSCWGGMVAFDGWYFQPQHHASRSLSAKSASTSSASSNLSPAPPALPLKFRSVENDTFWDASECCLIHADILASPSPPTYVPSQSTTEDKYNTGIYLNPYIRVSYSASTHAWLPFTRRFERLFAPIQIIFANPIGNMPRLNPRRTEMEGEIIRDRRWVRLNPLSSSTDQVPSKDHPHEIGSEDGTWQGDGIGERSNEKHTIQRPASFWQNEGFYEDYERLAVRGGYCGTRQLTVLKDRSRGEGDEGGLWDKLVDEVPPLER